ncbi:hypothetical protein GGF39_004039 [Coemansia sp. RSA 1721]|nr:hypothetical protein GGF39_004039 [Coemansia sp. RSA 1721]
MSTALQPSQPNGMRFEESVAAQYYMFMQVVLGTLRQMWAQVNVVLIVAGLLVLAALVAVVVATSQETPDQIVAWVEDKRRWQPTHASQRQALATALTAIVHGLAFSSNSFMFRKDSVVLYLVQPLQLLPFLGKLPQELNGGASECQHKEVDCGWQINGFYELLAAVTLDHFNAPV